MSSDLGKLIQQYREKAEITQSDLGRIMGVSQQTIAKWEAGKSRPRVKALGRLVRELKIDAMPSIPQTDSGDPDSVLDRELRTPRTKLISADSVPPPRGGMSLPEKFPSAAMFRHAVNTMALKRLLAPVVDEMEPTSKWNSVVQSQWGPMRLDYMNDEIWANFLHCPTTSIFSGYLRGPIYKYLWRFATLNGGVLETSHYQLLILTLPQDQPLNFPAGEAPAFSPPASNTGIMKRLMAEAMSLGIYVVLARTPEEVVSILTNPSYLGERGLDSLDA